MNQKKINLISNECFREWFELYTLSKENYLKHSGKFNTFLHAYSNLTNFSLSELMRLRRQASPIDYDTEYYRATGARLEDIFIAKTLKKACIKNKPLRDTAMLVENNSFLGMMSRASELKEFKTERNYTDLLSCFEYLQILLRYPIYDFKISITRDKYIKPLVVICGNDNLEKKALSAFISFAESLPDVQFSIEKLMANNLLFIGSFHETKTGYCVLRISFGNLLFFDEICGVTGHRPNISVLKEQISYNEIHSYLALPDDYVIKNFNPTQSNNQNQSIVKGFIKAIKQLKALIQEGYFEKLDSVSRYVSDMFMGLISGHSERFKDISEIMVFYHMRQVIKIISGFSEDDHNFTHKLNLLESLNNNLIQIILYIRPYENPLELLVTIQLQKYRYDFPDKKISFYYMPNGMRGLCACLEGVIDHYESLRIGYFENLYYETQQMIRAFLKGNQLIVLEKNKNPVVLPNIIFYDFKPNNARVSQIETIHLADLLSYCDTEDATVILDITLSNVANTELIDFIKLCSSRIVNGSLNLIILQSFSKYFQCGMDKFLGAYLLHLHSGEKYSGVRNKLKGYSEGSLISESSLQYFCHVLRYSYDHHYQYLQDIEDNGQLLYARIDTQNVYPEAVLSGNVISVSKLHDTHLYLGLSTHDFSKTYFPCKSTEFNALIFDYLNKEFCYRNYPVTERNSLGFASSVINNVYTAIRFVVGLEPEALIEEYAKLLNNICHTLNHIKGRLVNLLKSENTLTPDDMYRYFELALKRKS